MSPPEPTYKESVEVPLSAIEAVAEAALGAVVRVLQRRPDLVTALQELLKAPALSGPSPTQAFLSVVQYAAYRAVSERTVRYDVEEMEEGKHFHKVGRKRRRMVIHVQEADAWYVLRAGKRDAAVSVGQLAVDEVTRRRARVALKKRKEQR